MEDASIRNYKDSLIEALQSFKCCKDTDVQDFLNTRAIQFELRGWATTYLLFNKEAFSEGKLLVDGYFSLTHKALSFQQDVSNSLRNRLTGSKKSETHAFVLLGQLGKYIAETENGTFVSSSLTAKEMLDEAFGIIEQASSLIVDRNIIIECKPIEKIQQIYRDYGFTELQFDGQLHTMYARLDSTVNFS